MRRPHRRSMGLALGAGLTASTLAVSMLGDNPEATPPAEQRAVMVAHQENEDPATLLVAAGAGALVMAAVFVGTEITIRRIENS